MKKSDLSFGNEGTLYYQGFQSLLLPLNSFLAGIYEMNLREEKDFLEKNLIQASLKDCEIFYNKDKLNKLPKIKKIQEFLKFINNFGIGEVSLKVINQKQATFILKNNTLGKIFSSTFKCKAKIPLETITLGFLINFLELVFERKITFKISQINKNNSIFKLNITDTKIQKKQKKKYNYKKIGKKNSNQILKKILINNHLKSKEGILKLWNIYAVILPYYFLIEITKNLKDYEDFFMLLGNMQGKAAVGIQQSKFGIKKKELFKQITLQFDFLGMGTVILCEDNNCLRFTVNNNLETFFKKFYEQNEYKNVQNYINGDVKGIYEFIDKKEIKLKKDKNNFYQIIELNKERKLTEKEIEIDKFINAKILMNQK